MSVGACPVTSENCAGPDHIRNGINGFVIPLEDKNKWLETMSWCSANPAEIRRLGRNAQQYVKDHLTISCYSQFVSRLIEPEMDHYGFR
jgi:glycosyltransferase involved in cell wall biosynthesis